jgi:predicted phage terminase large subunit-like protein
VATAVALPEAIRTATLEQIEALLLPRRLSDYAKAAWQYIDPDPVVWGWHMDAICEHLQAIAEGKIQDLLITVPPGFSKSLLAAVMFPTWAWARKPSSRWMFASYDQALSTRDSVKRRQLVNSRWYQERWPLQITTDQNQKTYFENEGKGYMLATSVKGHATGQHPDHCVLDDLQDAQGAASALERLSTKEWVKATLATRGAGRGVRHVAIMQRLNEEDIASYFLELGYEHLMLPMRYEPSRSKVTCIGFKDPRTEPGELLDPKRYPEHIVTKLEDTLGPYHTAGQLQQRPSPAGGGLIKRSWFRCWVPPGEMDMYQPYNDGRGNVFPQRELPTAFEQELLSLDCNKLREAEDIRKKADSDPVSLGAWGRLGPDAFLLERVNDRLDLNETCEALIDMSGRHPKATGKVVEYAANGPYVMALLRKKIPGLIPATPEGSKTHRVLSSAKNDKEKDARALSMQVLFKAGNVWVPHPGIPGFEWVKDYIEQIVGFPTAPHDDDVDMTSQALAHLQPSVWLHEYHEKKKAEDSEPIVLNPAKHHQDKMHNAIKNKLRDYEKQRKRSSQGGIGL